MNNWEKLSAMADDQLSAEEADALKRAMQADPALQNQYDSILSLKRTLRHNLPQHDSPETLSLCRERFAELDRTTRTENVVHRFRYAFTAVLAVAIISAATLNRLGGDDVMGRNAVSQSLSASVAGGGGTVLDQSQAQAWLREQVTRSPFGARDLSLQRTDQLSVEGKPVNRCIYTDGESDYILLFVQGIVECGGDPVPGYPGLRQTRIDGLNALTWSEDNKSFVFAADRPVSTLLSYFKK
jgi:hypothetical protein